MNTMRKTLLVLLLLACCLSLSGCMLMGAMILGGDNDAVSKEEIYTYVAQNRPEVSPMLDSAMAASRNSSPQSVL